MSGLPAFGGNHRVKGLRREEVAMLAGVSIDYYVRLERGNLAGASESVLDTLARALQLDEAERDHLFALARAAGSGPRRRRTPSTSVRPGVQQVLDAISDAPAWVRNGRHDILALNQLGRALYAPILADPRRPANTTRLIYLDPAAREFFVDWERVANDAAAMLRLAQRAETAAARRRLSRTSADAVQVAWCHMAESGRAVMRSPNGWVWVPR